MRAWGYEKRIEEGKGGDYARRYKLEMRKTIRAGKGIGGWEGERREYYEKRGWEMVKVERRWDR